MKNEIVAAVHAVFKFGLDSIDNYSGERAWINFETLTNAFSDIPLKIDDYAEGGYCFAHIKVDGITFKTILKVTELQAHNIKALKGAA